VTTVGRSKKVAFARTGPASCGKRSRVNTALSYALDLTEGQPNSVISPAV